MFSKRFEKVLLFIIFLVFVATFIYAFLAKNPYPLGIFLAICFVVGFAGPDDDYQDDGVSF